MAKTLEGWKKEFAEIKKTIAAAADDVASSGTSITKHREILSEGFQEFGLRVHQLRDAGTPGAKVEDFIHDAEIKAILRELQVQRDQAKKTAKLLQDMVTNKVTPAIKRIDVMKKEIADEIEARNRKKSSTTLGLNQSVKLMPDLLKEITTYSRGGNDDYQTLKAYQADSPKEFDNMYEDHLKDELGKSKAVALSAFQQQMTKQMLDTRNLQKAFTLAKIQYQLVMTAAAQGKTAHQQRAVPELGNAKRDASAALDKLNDLVEPFEKAMKDKDIAKMVAKSQDKSAIEKGVNALFTMKTNAEQAEDTLRGRTMV